MCFVGTFIAGMQHVHPGPGKSPCHFNLPKAVTETGIALWTNLDDLLLQSATVCARGVINSVKQRKYWPPSDTVRYDDFELLFPGKPGDYLDADAFVNYLINAPNNS